MHNLKKISAGFTDRLYRLKPRASRSKGGLQQTMVRIEYNGRYMIIQIKLRQKFMSYLLFTKFCFIQLPWW